MLLSVRQYAALFGVLIITLISVFAYKINVDMKQVQREIETSQQTSALSELHHVIEYTMHSVRQSASRLAQWQEVRQQINNPQIFAYWYNVRFKKSAFDLQKYTADLMLYDANGKALAQLDDNTLPYQIDITGIRQFQLSIVSSTDIIYIQPIISEIDNVTIIGYLSTRLHLLPMLKSVSQLHHINIDSLALRPDSSDRKIEELQPENFSYTLLKAQSILILETQMRDFVLDIALIIAIPAIIFYTALIIIVGLPIKGIDHYINQLRQQPGTLDETKYQSFFQVSELKSVYDSLNKYHSELSEKEENLSLTLNSIGDAVITTDEHTRIVRMNPVAEQLTGWSFDDARGLQVKQVFVIKQQAAGDVDEDIFDMVLRTGQIEHIRQNSVLLSKDGKEYSIADSAAPIRDNHGEIHGIVLVFNDITLQKMRDEQLQHSMKMEALGKLTGGIAHDFNNVLGIILGYSELLIAELEQHPGPRGYAQHIFNAGERARKLTSQLLTFSSKRPPESSLTDVNQLIRADTQMLEKTLTARVNLQLELQADLWPVYLEQSQLQDAILNISINAMHAMPDGGSLTISTRNIHIGDKDLFHVDLRNGDYVQLSFTDTGSGMDQDTCQKIFDPFFTTKGAQGTGLGLSQVYGFVQQSNGSIHAYSEVGFGTRIVIYLPRYQQTEQAEPETQTSLSSQRSMPTGKETILVVDDEASLLELSCQILREQGYHTLCAQNGDEALAVLAQQPVDLILTDVIMPQMDGYQLAAMVTEKYPHVKIQLISGFSDDRDRANIDPGLQQRQLQKPFTAEELLGRIRDLLDE